MNNAPPPTEIYNAGFDPQPHWLPPRLPPNPNAMGEGPADSPLLVAYRVASLAGAVSGAYHGYKRHGGSVGWAFGWFVFGGLLPMFSIPLSLAEGYGKPKKNG